MCVCVCWTQQRALQKRVNRSKCRLAGRLARKNMFQIGCTLAPPGEYDGMISDTCCRYRYCSSLFNVNCYFALSYRPSALFDMKRSCLNNLYSRCKHRSNTAAQSTLKQGEKTQRYRTMKVTDRLVGLKKM